MAFARAKFLFKASNTVTKMSLESNTRSCRSATTTSSGAIRPEPYRSRFGYVGVIGGVTVGLLIGATISKNVANFLEENDLFVPSDDDDDDDD